MDILAGTATLSTLSVEFYSKEQNLLSGEQILYFLKQTLSREGFVHKLANGTSQKLSLFDNMAENYP